MMESINTMESAIEVYVILLTRSEEDQCVLNSRRDLHYKWVCLWTGEMTLEARERATLAEDHRFDAYRAANNCL